MLIAVSLPRGFDNESKIFGATNKDSNSVAEFTVYGGIDITLLQAWFSYIWCKSERCGLAISGTQEGNAIYGTLFNERKKNRTHLCRESPLSAIGSKPKF